MESINAHIESDKKELEDPSISPQRRRHISDELRSLEKYKEDHPDVEKDPSCLELYCNEHPDALECRCYE
jgi:hypothetical protein